MPSRKAHTDERSWWKRHFATLLPEEPVAKFTALIFVVNVLYVVVTTVQLYLLRESNEGSQRAWVVTKSFTPLVPEKEDGRCPIIATDQRPPDKDLPPPPQPMKPGVAYCVMITVENAGNGSPAIVTSLASWAATLEQEQTFLRNPPYNVGQTRRGRSVIGPKDAFFLMIPHIGGAVFGANPIDVVRQIGTGERRLYLYGRFSYSDSFSRSRETKFCAVYIPATRGFDACEAYNDAR